ncbi:ABC-2 type transport system permease protein [Thermocatellispora tengchongensis]|uniref:Transport permease protein n=1 Tax=Thermocatellispora tengchongensis TaxID=1073253 RepID=A0A840NZV4_9ACTN|nr:ABC transporter permease [Thermocatellispora tengchongensis]MBB5132279.1 ABC-2 type transport system permease protein [Thermocatellispora tengchongensis]
MRRELSVAGVLVAHEWRVQRRDLVPQLILTVMPLVLMAFLLPTYQAAMAATGEPGTGAEQAVAGLSVMFSMFLVSHVGMVFFRDHGWNTWNRFRATPVPVGVLVLSKAVVPLGLLLAQFTVLISAGALFFGLRVKGSLAALALVVLLFAACLVALGVLGFAVCRTVVQMTSAANILAITMAGLGGALVPQSLLPAWAAPVAPATPSYWAVRGMREVVSTGAGVAEVAAELAALAAFAALFSTLAVVLLKPDQRKISWS